MYEKCYLHADLSRVYIFDSKNNTWVNFKRTLHKQHIEKIATYLLKKRKKPRPRGGEIATTRSSRFNRAVNEYVAHERAARSVYVRSELHAKTVSKNASEIKQWLNALLITLFDDLMLADNHAEHYSICRNHDICDIHDR